MGKSNLMKGLGAFGIGFLGSGAMAYADYRKQAQRDLDLGKRKDEPSFGEFLDKSMIGKWFKKPETTVQEAKTPEVKPIPKVTTVTDPAGTEKEKTRTESVKSAQDTVSPSGPPDAAIDAQGYEDYWNSQPDADEPVSVSKIAPTLEMEEV